MKAAVLAAGSATRLRPLTENRPKCLLEVGGKSLLEHQLDLLSRCRVEEAVVVVGYQAPLVRALAGKIGPKYNFGLKLVYNHDYARTNNLHSLWAARELLRGSPFICLHGDLLMDGRIAEKCLGSPDEICLAIDRQLAEETMKVRIAGRQIVAVGKHITAAEASGTFIGLAKFSAAAGERLWQAAEQLVAGPEKNLYFTAAIEHLIARGERVGFITTDGLPWIEIDFPEELVRARQLFKAGKG